jgi:YHS domain-containing protein
MEFKVSDKTHTIEKDGKKYFVCSEGCAEKIKANPDKMIPILETKAKEARKHTKIGGNVMYLDESGTKIAMCCCGGEMKVSSSSVTRVHHGETFYFCCDNCAKNFDKDPAAACKNFHGKMSEKLGKKDKGI